MPYLVRNPEYSFYCEEDQMNVMSCCLSLC